MRNTFVECRYGFKVVYMRTLFPFTPCTSGEKKKGGGSRSVHSTFYKNIPFREWYPYFLRAQRGCPWSCKGIITQERRQTAGCGSVRNSTKLRMWRFLFFRRHTISTCSCRIQLSTLNMGDFSHTGSCRLSSDTPHTFNWIKGRFNFPHQCCLACADLLFNIIFNIAAWI